jgi:hypothetical protein
MKVERGGSEKQLEPPARFRLVKTKNRRLKLWLLESVFGTSYVLMSYQITRGGAKQPT